MEGDRWHFLLPWCQHLSWRLQYVKGDSPELRFRGVEVELPSFGPYSDAEEQEEEAEEDSKSPCQDVREALALLSAAAHVDNAAWKKLLVDHVKLSVKSQEELFEEGEFPPRFQLALVGGGPDGDGELLRGITEFCGTEQYTVQSPEYREALAAVAAQNGEKSCTGSTEIEVPITVQLGPWLTSTSGDMFDYLRRVQETVGDIRTQWQQSLDRTQGSLSVAFVLESIMVDLRDVSISAELAELVESLAKDGIRVSGLALRHELGQELASNGSLAEARKAVGRLMFGLFGGAKKLSGWEDFDFEATSMTGPLVAEYGHAQQLDLSSVNFDSEAMQNWVFDRICSAVAVSQTTKHLSLDLELADGNDDDDGDWALCRWRWQWIVFACFSEKARLHSRLESLMLRNAVITTEAVEAMAEVLASDAPEEALLGIASNPSEPGMVCIKANSPIKLLPMYANEVFESSSSFTLEREINDVRILSKDDQSDWADVLVPGFGKCQVHRSGLISRELTLPSNGLAGVTTLAMKFGEDPDPAVLQGLLLLIGASLTHLTLEFEDFSTSELEGIVASCPNLVELAVCTHTIELRFCLRDINYRDLVLDPDSHLPLWWGIQQLAEVLCDSENPLTKCTRRLRVRMDQRSVAHSYDGCYAALLNMLEVNRTLEYLDIVAQRSHMAHYNEFKAHHLESLPAVRTALSMDCKAAFLSVMSTGYGGIADIKRRKYQSPLPSLDQHVLVCIFDFAAPSVTRRVYFREYDFFETGRHYMPI